MAGLRLSFTRPILGMLAIAVFGGTIALGQMGPPAEATSCSCDNYALCSGLKACGKEVTCSCCRNGPSAQWNCTCCDTEFDCLDNIPSPWQCNDITAGS